VSSGPNIPDAQRKSPRLTGVTLPADVAEALAAHLERTGEGKSAVVARGVRREVGPHNDPREPIERWLASLESSARRYGTQFGIWRPKSGAHVDRRFYAKTVTWIYGALHFVGVEDGASVVMPIWQIRRDWERCDPGADDSLDG
jgi:hypothetical protein